MWMRPDVWCSTTSRAAGVSLWWGTAAKWEPNRAWLSGPAWAPSLCEFPGRESAGRPIAHPTWASGQVEREGRSCQAGISEPLPVAASGSGFPGSRNNLPSWGRGACAGTQLKLLQPQTHPRLWAPTSLPGTPPSTGPPPLPSTLLGPLRGGRRPRVCVPGTQQNRVSTAWLRYH